MKGNKMELKKLYGLLDQIGTLSFSTISNGEVHSRIAHFNGYDDQGLYLRSMINKPFARQLKESGKVTVCGISNSEILGHDENGVPKFPTGFSIRLIGEVKSLTEEEVRELAKSNQAMELAVYDMEKYPAMKEGNFVIHKAKVEIFDFDFDCLNRDHKLLRKRFSFGGMTFNEAGPKITDQCIACGKCKNVCSFKAIEAGETYEINSSRCDDCGSCINICPVNAIEVSKVF